MTSGTSRYFVEISYKGTNYVGWQRQKNGISVQGIVEQSLSTLFGRFTVVFGCGRTDAGVHASQYVFHFDSARELDHKFWYSFSSILPRDIAYIGHQKRGADFHARHSALSRRYTYKIHSQKDPFLWGLSSYMPKIKEYDFKMMQLAADILKNYEEFYPFCKTGSDTPHMMCRIETSEWARIDENTFEYNIEANRFLRGMVRLIVGMCLNIGNEKIEIEDLVEALEKQKSLKKSLSAPAEGLYLSAIHY